MPVFTKKVSTTDPRFHGRQSLIVSPREAVAIGVPNNVVLCNGCNENIHPHEGYLVYLGVRELKADQPYDLYCGVCVKRYFPKAKEVT